MTAGVYPDAPDAIVGGDGTTRWTFEPCSGCGEPLNVIVGAKVDPKLVCVRCSNAKRLGAPIWRDPRMKGDAKERPMAKAKATPKVDDKGEHVVRVHREDLPCVLSQDELLAKGDAVAKLHEAAADLKVKKKIMTDEISGEIKGKEGAIKVLVTQIRTRSEKREVVCKDVADYERGLVVTYRNDTGQEIATRALLDSERQRPLPLKGIGGGMQRAVDDAFDDAPDEASP